MNIMDTNKKLNAAISSLGWFFVFIFFNPVMCLITIPFLFGVALALASIPGFLAIYLFPSLLAFGENRFDSAMHIGLAICIASVIFWLAAREAISDYKARLEYLKTHGK